MASEIDSIETIEVRDKSKTRKGHGQGPPPVKRNGDFDPGGDGSNGEARRPIGNAFIAMLLFLGADLMFFSGFIGGFVVFRFGADDWPPIGQPTLPIEVTAFNTIVLLASGYFMWKTWRTLKEAPGQVIRNLGITLALGAFFLVVQGYEWTRLIGFGLKLSTGVFGATFYTLIGCHALHVLGAVVWLFVVLLKAKKAPLVEAKANAVRVKLVGMYWFLVVALWPILYGLVYLS